MNNASGHFPNGHWRNIVLKKIYESLSNDGLLGCIRDAIIYHPVVDPSKEVDETVNSYGDKLGFLSQKGWIPETSQNAAERHLGVVSNGAIDESNHRTVTELCQHAFFTVIISQEFASLCKLLLENFQGIKFDSFFDLSLINSRMKEGAYECSPMLFLSDIHQVWGKLEKIGSEMLSIAKSLSDISRISCHEWVGGVMHENTQDGRQEVGGVMHENSEDGRQEICTRESDCHEKMKHASTCSVSRVCSCCGDGANEKDCLLCDSCEVMYHISCIEPAIRGTPPRSWYCANCSSNRRGSPHDDCVVCERQDVTRDLKKEVDNLDPMFKELSEAKESSDNIVNDVNSLPLKETSSSLCCCKVCNGKLDSGEEFRVCSYQYCWLKYYHVRCLTKKQSKSYGPRWYCPSCLCRVCLTDKDDNKIVMCDRCNHGYHTYCMEPPRTSIPEGNWFCKKCAAIVHSIYKTEFRIENFEKVLRKQEEGKPAHRIVLEGQAVNGHDVLNKGMSMLLNAVETLNNKEELMASEAKS